MYRDEVALFDSIATAVGAALDEVTDWGPSGRREGQYAADLIADRIVLDALADAGLSVLSEESGLTLREPELLVIADPLDGSTNASRGIPWYATSLALVDGSGLAAGLVRNQSNGVTYSAERGHGAVCDGAPIRASGCERLQEAFVGLSGMPPRYLGWNQYRALGAAALDLCLVAAGVLDGYFDCSADAHGVWDYAAGWLICAEAGAHVADAHDRDLLVHDHALKRTPIAAATPVLLTEMLTARADFA